MTATFGLVDTPRGKISYLEAGQGPPLLLLHGIGSGAASWVAQIDSFSIGTGSSPGMPLATVTLTR